ncbi:hypothetical protein VF04_24185, partial [Nostoc linckia z7]
MDQEFLEKRLKKLNWTPYRLAKEICVLRSEGGKVPPVTQYQSAVNKAVAEPRKSKLETIEELVQALGGTLTISWDDEPEVTKIKLQSDIALALQEQARAKNITLEELVNHLLQQNSFGFKKEEPYIPASSLKGLLRSLIPELLKEAANSTLGGQLNDLNTSIQQLTQYLNQLEVSPNKRQKAECSSSGKVHLSSSFPSYDFKNSAVNIIEQLEKSLSIDTKEHPYLPEMILQGKEYGNIGIDLDNTLESIENSFVAASFNHQKAQELMKLGLDFIKTKEFKKGIKNLYEAIKIYPEFAQAYGTIGLVNLYYLKDFQVAIDNFSQTIKLGYKQGKAHFFRGIAYLNVELFQEAIKDFTEAIRFKYDEELCYLERGKCYLRIEEFQKAI